MNRVSVPRIRSICLKNGGTKIHIFNNNLYKERCDSLTNRVKEITKDRKDDLAGYAIVAWSANGAVSTAMYVPDGRYVTYTQAPNFIKDALTSLAWEI